MPADYKPISIADKFKNFSEVFQPRVIAKMSEYEFRAARSTSRSQPANARSC
jgi:hypothetical protein